ncbi:MAG: 3-hydroxyacyl-CoA dehydrogenase family protein [Euryarchaeota archaeon]|jgi:3-hydroxybutyryl-CoA dehydrogenase|nr:3-hydroxyacyl-CoA dehydrogenase family protein [Euryarchaeota archaeon]MBT6559773.1 3-hydroxyacyl-CoA dehydrogenase family protein [Euryarchaeota archaeon]MBT6908662.1 3-hydroxyacyl-CoA dehydrogenase family protein [Euryarchaeota archaeon]MBT7116721.1 3-hydroxyacyl-CoA dehydrogenase family protein [Euryarchaeota archaeon]MBT7820366.1 3-hydroxyacyl-CoA dehydrogenase family protein [Euryarchaeota archaeon]
MQVRTVAVIGAGTMGSGIAQVCAQSGWETRLFDAFPESLQKGMNNINLFWNKGIEKGKTTVENKEKWSKNLKEYNDLSEAVEGVDLVIEAVPEIMELKKELFIQLEKIAPKHAILATNTSSIPISIIASVTKCPERVIGMHFFNPVPIMKLLELVKHEKCSDKTIVAAQSIGKIMGKETILVKDVPGFATSRLGVVLGNEAIRMLAEGVASASDIDTAMRLGYKHPMGPLELSDLVGLDVRRDILNGLADSFDDNSYRPHRLLDSLVSEGSLGKKTNKGIYNWTGNGKEERNDLPE